MTPEERAKAVVSGDGWERVNYIADERGEEFPDVTTDRAALERLVAEAIRAAVAEERERCAVIATTAAIEWRADVDRGSSSAPLLQGMIDGANIVGRRIRAALDEEPK